MTINSKYSKFLPFEKALSYEEFKELESVTYPMDFKHKEEHMDDFYMDRKITILEMCESCVCYSNTLEEALGKARKHILAENSSYIRDGVTREEASAFLENQVKKIMETAKIEKNAVYDNEGCAYNNMTW